MPLGTEKPLLTPLYNDIVQHFRTFLMVGGMPASVEAWVSTHDYTQCQAELDDIQLAYYDDFPKYAKKVDPTAGNGLPLGAEVNEKFRKYIYLDSGLLLRILDLDLGGARQLTELIIAGTTEDLVNKGGLAEMMLGWELVKYNNPRTQHELYYWENTAEGTRSEVDYIIARDLKVLPIECKAGVSGKMKSLYEFMRQKHLTEAVRCSLENFSELDYVDKKDNDAIRHVQLIPLFSVSNLFRTKNDDTGNDTGN